MFKLSISANQKQSHQLMFKWSFSTHIVEITNIVGEKEGLNQ